MALTSNLTLNFDEPVQAGTDNTTLYLKDGILVGLDDNVVIERADESTEFQLFNVADTGSLTLVDIWVAVAVIRFAEYLNLMERPQELSQPLMLINHRG